MSPASYRAAPPRVARSTLAHRYQYPQKRTTVRAGAAERPRPERYPGTDGAGEGLADPEGVGLGAAACCAFWYSVIASWSACSACPYLPKSPACCAALRSPSALLILATAAWSAPAFGWDVGGGWFCAGGFGVVAVGWPPAALTSA